MWYMINITNMHWTDYSFSLVSFVRFLCRASHLNILSEKRNDDFRFVDASADNEHENVEIKIWK